MRLQLIAAAAVALAAFAPGWAPAQEAPDSHDAQDLAKKLSNPVAALISVPFQNNYDWGLGPDGHGRQYKLNFQPVIPITLNDEWNLISRTIVPVIAQDNVLPAPRGAPPGIGGGSQSGLSDIVQSLFFSPKAPTSNGWIWGAGPVFLLPTATDSRLGTEKWGAGPTVVLLRQQGHWTYGILANHIWSFAGRSNRSEVSSTFLQPFLSYTTRKATTFGANSESTYDWVTRQWTAPINLSVAQLFKPSKGGLPLPIQVQVGYRYYADKPSGGPHDGVRLTITALFPR
jgi:hypothetical protein